MIVATQVRAGMTILHDKEPYTVLTVSHITPGKGRGMVSSKLRNLKTGSTTEYRFRSDEKVEKARLEQREMDYLYNDAAGYHFMDSATYEQISLDADLLGDNINYLIENIKFIIEFYDGSPVGVEPPKVVELKVIDTAPRLKGATATASYKPATMENGLVVNVPDFVEIDTVIRIDTEEGKYLDRAKTD